MTKAAINRLGVTDSIPAEIRVFDRLFTDAQPAASGDFLSVINRDSKTVLRAVVGRVSGHAAPAWQGVPKSSKMAPSDRFGSFESAP